MNRHSMIAVPPGQRPERESGFVTKEPLSEPHSGKRRYIKWSRLGEDELVQAVNRIVVEKGIRSMSHMKESDNSMFRAVKERGAEGKISFANGQYRRPAAPLRPTNENAAKEEKPLFTHTEATELAQSIIDDGGLLDMDEMKIIEPEVHELALKMGIVGKLSFRNTREIEARNDETAPDSNEKPGHARAEITEEEMYRRICADCFRMGHATPYIGNRRGTIPKLQSGMHRKLPGPQQRLFRRCWDRMVAEGAIVNNSNDTAASLNPHCQVRNEALGKALRWAITEQAAVGRGGAENAHL